jgi:hypothetical protein
LLKVEDSEIKLSARRAERVYCSKCGRAIAQAVSRWLPTAAARVRTQVRSCGICDGQNGTGIGFLRVLRFPLPILIQSTAFRVVIYHAGQLVADVQFGLSLTPPQDTKKKKKCYSKYQKP